MSGLEVLLQERPVDATLALGAGVTAHEFVVVDTAADLVPLAEGHAAAFLADSVPPTGQASTAAFNSNLGVQEDAFQSYLDN